MKTKIYPNEMKNPDKIKVECVERKGLGHPDTLSDMIANHFSNVYSRQCLSDFGFIPHHWADKVTIVGGQSEVGYGYGELTSPMKIFQFGRMTQKVGSSKIDIDGLFEQSVHEILTRVFGDNYRRDLVQCDTLTHSSSGPDHPKEFYNPSGTIENHYPKSNDTIILTAYSPLSQMEEMVTNVENYVNGNSFKREHPYTGTDVKVLAARIENEVDLTLCIPFIGERTPCSQFYKKKLGDIYDDLVAKVESEYPDYSVNMNINTKDEGDRAYLTLIGTSCDKGGCGAVGRGNKYNGLISVNREMAVEAPAGKNPTHHSGRLYSEAIHRLTKSLHAELNIPNYVNLIARNGDPLDDPAILAVKGIDDINESYFPSIKEMTSDIISKTTRLTNEVIHEDPIYAHINKARDLL
ncbi:MAG: methionine adenosyltransferase [bacterium]